MAKQEVKWEKVVEMLEGKEATEELKRIHGKMTELNRLLYDYQGDHVSALMSVMWGLLKPVKRELRLEFLEQFTTFVRENEDIFQKE